MECLRISLKKAVRILAFKSNTEHSIPLFKNNNILPLDEEVKLKQGKFIWKLEYNLLPSNIIKLFIKNSSTISTRHSSKNNYCLPAVRLGYAKRFITYSDILLLNIDIPTSIKDLQSMNIFLLNIILT